MGNTTPEIRPPPDAVAIVTVPRNAVRRAVVNVIIYVMNKALNLIRMTHPLIASADY